MTTTDHEPLPADERPGESPVIRTWTERDVLHHHLDSQRGHVLGALDGLTEEQLRRPVLPSGWSCLGLLKHLALADERYWFSTVVGGAPLDFPEEPGADWNVDDESVADVFDLYRSEMDRSDRVILATDPDAPPAWKDPLWAEWGMDFPNLRFVLGHMIVETSVHAGHVDAVRELLDGRQWVVV